MKKVILGFGLLLIMGVFAFAEPVQLDPVGAVDISKFFGNVRAGYLYGHEKLVSAYIPVISVVGNSKAEYLNLDIGCGYNSDTKKGKPIMGLGLRVDSFLSKLGRSAGPHVVTAVFPPLELQLPVFLIDFSKSKPFSRNNIILEFGIAYRLGGAQ